MYSPDKFVQLNEIYKVCINLSYDRFPVSFVSDDSFDPIDDVRANLYYELLFYRFIENNIDNMWIFKFPDITLRASPELFHRPFTYEGPCPDDPKEAEFALSHIKRGSMIFINSRFRITSKVPDKYIHSEAILEAAAELKPVDGAIVLWKPENWPVDIERAIWPLRDPDYFKGHPFSKLIKENDKKGSGSRIVEDFKQICPDGKQASGLTWEEIQRRSGWSRRSIVRAVRECEDWNSGQEDGQQVGKSAK